MNVGELIEYLKRHDPEMEVVLQKDAEGNGYSHLASADVGIYVAHTNYYGDFYDPDWSAEDCGMDDEEYENMLSLPRSIVLWPVN